MALITGFAIDEANEMELAEGGLFGDTLCGRQVIEAARELLQQQDSPAGEPLPLCVFFERQDDMGQGRLRLILDGDSDVSIAVISTEGEMSDVEFCTPFSGGGRSPKVREALLNLARAIRDENVTNPIERGMPSGRAAINVEPTFAVATKSTDDEFWQIAAGALFSDAESAGGHAIALANAGDSETQYCAVKIERSGITPTGEVAWGIREL